MATDPFGLREMFLDAQDQTEDWARDQRAEYLDGAVLGDDRDDYPDKAELDEMARWDRLADKADRR